MNKASTAQNTANNQDYHKSRLFMIRFIHLAKHGKTNKEIQFLLKLSKYSVTYWAEKFKVEIAKAQKGRISDNVIKDNYGDDFRYNDEISAN